MAQHKQLLFKQCAGQRAQNAQLGAFKQRVFLC